MAKISKASREARIQELAQEMRIRDKIAYSKNSKAPILVGDLCEILEGITADQICRQVGDMSSQQWSEYLVMLLKDISVRRAQESKLIKAISLLSEARERLIDLGEEDVSQYNKFLKV